MVIHGLSRLIHSLKMAINLNGIINDMQFNASKDTSGDSPPLMLQNPLVLQDDL